MPGGCPKGIKNKKGHKASGDCKGIDWERNVSDKNSKKLAIWTKRVEENRKKKQNLKDKKLNNLYAQKI